MLTAVDNGVPGDTTGLPVITSTLTLRGQQAETTILARDPSAPPFRLVSVAPAGTLTLRGLTLRGGGQGAFLRGGGIRNDGTLTLRECLVTENGADFGGGLSNNSGTVTITHTTFDGNGASFGGGGLINNGGTVTITATTFVRNSSTEVGGGLLNQGVAGSQATVSLTNTTFAHNIANLQGTGFGGGLVNFSIPYPALAILHNTTFVENSGGFPFGGGALSGGPIIVQNTILAHNTGGDCAVQIISLGNNLIGDPTGPTGCTNSLHPTDLTGAPGLDTFTDNGRPGHGHFPLLPTSQAIDAGNDAVCPRRDQLGQRRIGPCDIGAIRFLDHTDIRQHEEDPAPTAQASQ